MHSRRAALSWMVLLVGAVTAPTTALAHGGGLDRNGGHHDRQRGGYHCHRDPCREPEEDSPEREPDGEPDSERDPQGGRGRGRRR